MDRERKRQHTKTTERGDGRRGEPDDLPAKLQEASRSAITDGRGPPAAGARWMVRGGVGTTSKQER